MRVAVFGSWKNPAKGSDDAWWFTGPVEAFTAACNEIGRELAEKRYTLVVESDRSFVADRHVVDGYVEYAKSNTIPELQIELVWPRGAGQQPFQDDFSQHQNLFRYYQLPIGEAGQQQWSNSHLVSLKHADAVMTIGGKQGTYLAGSAAIVARKPLVPIASFGGASARLLADLSIDRAEKWNPAFYTLNGPWSDHVLATAIDLLKEQSTSDQPPLKTVFISHAHKDVELAEAVVNVIEAAFDIPTDAIRATSVPGHKLPAGTHTATQLRQEIEGAGFVLGLVTPNSIESKYVLFELGAAWGLGRRTFPLVARGVKPSDVPGPVGELHYLDLTKNTDCYQLLEDLESSKIMGKAKPGGKVTLSHTVDRVVELAGFGA